MKVPWRREAASHPGVGPSSERLPPAPTNIVTPTLLAWAEALDATTLSDKTVKNAERFLRTYKRMFDIGARREMAMRIRSTIETEVNPRPPVSIGNMDVIATALQVRRRQLGYGETGPGS
jgi:hypothetical protein